ncbi:MAG: FkbM family methyltransferase [Anaerolineales bacterium]|nr:FkbM family methyltransferase [Anaerolineales bacterium]
MSEMFNLRSAPELPQKPLRFMQIDTFYPKPLEILYGRNPNLSNLTFSEQMDAILKDGFAAIHTIGPYMSDIGYDAQWIIGNCVPTQVQWAHEHGFQFKDNNTAMHDIVRAQVDTFKPDILYTTDSILFDSKFIRTLNHHPKLVIGWQAADIPPGADWSGFDIILSPLEGVRSTALELGARYAEYFLPGFPEWIHKQVQKIESSVDVSFCGQWNLLQHQHRNDLLQQIALAASEEPSFSCGFYLSGQVNAIPPEVARYNRGERYGMDMYRSIRTGKIGLDARGNIRLFRHDSGKGVGDSDIAGRETANMRIFETTGCGVFLLTEHFDNLNQFFEPGQEIETFRNEKELIEKIRYYLVHPREREEIAQRGYERCRRDHSIQQSTRLLDTIIRKHLTVEASHSSQTVPPLSHEAWSVIEANRDLLNIKNIGLHSRFGRWQIHLEDLTVYCHDLVSFYYSARDIFLNRIYDFEATNPQPTIIDGGGFIGLFTLYAKKKYPQARVTIFEPNPEALPLLKGNLAVNNIQDITLVEAGLYNHNGVIPFESDGSDGSSAYTHQATSRIKVNRLNDFINSEVDFLKLNIEGAEWAVIADIEPKLKFVRELVIEYHGFPETGQNLHKILAVLDRAGFRYFIHDFDRESNPTTKPPFKIAPETRFFQLIYAKRLFSPVESEVVETASSVTAPSLQPVSRLFGFDRGIPLDRYYIERFLEQNSALIQGRVLEIGDNTYTRRFGHDVTRSDILSYTPAPGATIIGDLVTEKRLPEVTFDCIILTQTLQMIYDLKTALQNLYKALKPGGSLLISASGISQISRYDMDQWGEYWRFTDKSLKMLLAEFVPEKGYSCGKPFGNVAVAKSFF